MLGDPVKISRRLAEQLGFDHACGELGELFAVAPTTAVEWGLGQDADGSSELVVTRAAGRSGLAALIAPVMVSAVIGAIAVAMFNPIVAATSKRYSDLSEIYQNGGSNALSIGKDGLWLRQGGPEGQTVIHARGAGSSISRRYGPTLHSARRRSCSCCPGPRSSP